MFPGVSFGVIVCGCKGACEDYLQLLTLGEAPSREMAEYCK